MIAAWLIRAHTSLACDFAVPQLPQVVQGFPTNPAQAPIQLQLFFIGRPDLHNMNTSADIILVSWNSSMNLLLQCPPWKT